MRTKLLIWTSMVITALVTSCGGTVYTIEVERDGKLDTFVTKPVCNGRPCRPSIGPDGQVHLGDGENIYNVTAIRLLHSCKWDGKPNP